MKDQSFIGHAGYLGVFLVVVAVQILGDDSDFMFICRGRDFLKCEKLVTESPERKVYLMESALLGVLENLCANCLFLPVSLLLTWGLAAALGILVYNWYGRPIIWAKRLFGLGRKNRIDVFVSQSQPSEATTRTGVMTSAEMTAVEELKDALGLAFQIPANVELLVEKIGAKELRPTVPDLKIRQAPTEDLKNPIASVDSLLLVGGPVRNRVTEYYLDHCEAWLKFDPEEKSFVTLAGNPDPRPIPNCNAVLQKVGFGSTVVFIVFGTGEEQTAVAVKYLAQNWEELYHEFNGKDFGIALQVSTEDTSPVKVLERLPTGHRLWPLTI